MRKVWFRLISKLVCFKARDQSLSSRHFSEETLNFWYKGCLCISHMPWCGINQGPGEGNNCQEENSSSSDCQSRIQEMAQIYLAHLTGVIWNYLEIKHRVMSIAGVVWIACDGATAEIHITGVVRLIMFDNISIALNCSPAEANRGARRT